MRALAREPCALCGLPCRGGTALCAGCAAELPRLPAPVCGRCASPVGAGALCGTCLGRPPQYDAVHAAWVYDFPVDALVQRYKYGGELRLARLFGRAVSNAVAAHADVLIPVPLSQARLRTRGYNQALEIAREIGRARHIPVWPDACRRVTDTPAQALLPWRERPRNVRGAFVCDVELAGCIVAVVDDVLTTGATLDALARSLKRAGAAQVQGWVVARAVPRLYRPSHADLAE